MKNKQKQPSTARGFFIGVVACTWIGMAGYIAAPHFVSHETGTTPQQYAEMAEALRLSTEDLK